MNDSDLWARGPGYAAIPASLVRIHGATTGMSLDRDLDRHGNSALPRRTADAAVASRVSWAFAYLSVHCSSRPSAFMSSPYRLYSSATKSLKLSPSRKEGGKPAAVAGDGAICRILERHAACLLQGRLRIGWQPLGAVNTAQIDASTGGPIPRCRRHVGQFGQALGGQRGQRAKPVGIEQHRRVGDQGGSFRPERMALATAPPPENGTCVPVTPFWRR